MFSPSPRLLLLLLVVALSGCRTIALDMVSSAVAESGGGYASDDDPLLVSQAAPFGLKTMEGLLEQRPRHVGLLTALASGFTEYGYAFVQADADLADLNGQLEPARAGRERARKLYLRARGYGLRGLDVKHAGLRAALETGDGSDLRAALARCGKDDVPLLYWTASAWVLAISNGKGDMALVAQLPAPVAMLERALALDEGWGEGSIHEVFVALDASRGPAEGGGPLKAKQHLDRALALSHGQKLGAKVSYAEGVLVQQQDRAEFTRLLQEVAGADVEAAPAYRLPNTLAQRRARALLAHIDDLFL